MSLFNHTLILKNDGTLWGCGYNGYGQLGLNDTTNRTTFTQITTNANDVKSIYCGENYTIILKNDGTLWGCGENIYGQLGLGDTTNRTIFTQVTTNINDIKSVYCGYWHTLILKNNGILCICGRNNCSQLGLGETNNKTTFTEITKNIDNIKSVYCGVAYNLILKNDSTLWGCGANNYGQLGLNDITNRSIFTIIGINTGDIKSVYCGHDHAFILKNDNTLWGCGLNDYGQLGLGDTTNRYTFTQITTNVDNIKSIYCGWRHTFILKNDGTLWGCGYNNDGQLGLGDTNYRYTFTQVTTNVNDIKSVCCGENYIIILKNDGTLWGCGLNNCGQLGLGDTNNRLTFTQITTNIDDIKCFANDYNIPSTIKIYDSGIGYIETVDTNNFRNIPINTVERLKSLCVNPVDTHLNCLVSFDQKQTWKVFNGNNWNTISDISPENIILNGMDVSGLNQLDRNKLITGGFTGDIDFKIAMKTNNVNKTPSVTKIYIEYK